MLSILPLESSQYSANNINSKLLKSSVNSHCFPSVLCLTSSSMFTCKATGASEPSCFLLSLLSPPVQRAPDQASVPGHLQDPDTSVQGAAQPPAGEHAQVGPQGRAEAAEGRADP